MDLAFAIKLYTLPQVQSTFQKIYIKYIYIYIYN